MVAFRAAGALCTLLPNEIMEQEFDKEIDALLRTTRDRDVARSPDSAHLDTDTIAAFAENALPAKSRMLSMAHLADCDRCRGILAGSMAWPPAEEPSKQTVVTAGSVAGPWYKNLFRIPNLAFTMGGLVLVFGGILAVLVVTRNSADRNATVSQISPNEGMPQYSAPSSSSSAANMAVQAVSNAASNSVSNAAVPASRPPDETSKPEGRIQTEPAGPPSNSADAVEDKPAAERSRTAGSAPQPPIVGASRPPAADAKSESEKEDSSQNMRAEGRLAAAPPAPAPNKKAAAFSRDGTNQNAERTADSTRGAGATSSAMVPAVKTAGGKRFEKRDGAWYDAAYHGQGTRDIRRGSPAYKELDAGLRSVAASVGGVVIIVWKGVAYRIQ